MEQIYDVAVLGGGPGGYTAALYCARAGLSTVVLEKLSPGGQMATTSNVENYPGFAEGVDGFDLAMQMKDGAERFGVETLFADATAVALEGGVKTITTSSGERRARTVILATGADPRPLGVPHEDELRGRGVGLCGMDGQMLRCTELDPQLGHVGEIVHVDATLIESLLDGGFIPVIATVGMDDLGQAYNVNADTAAAQIAIALKAEKLVSMTDIAGLLRDKEDETTLIPEVEVTEIEGYKSAGIIAGGMIPKIGGMADAIYQGVHEAVIIDGRVPHSILLELFSDRGSGTRFYRRSHRE